MSFERITTDPDRMGGQACIRGLLEADDVAEALRYAAQAVRK